VLVFSFVLGLIVVTTQNVTLPAWAYIVSLLLGMFIAPFVRLPACARTGTGHITNPFCRAPFCTLVTAMVLPLITCRRCWQV
jgi:hypothetical protein